RRSIMGENGVTVTIREIYESVNNMTNEVTQLGSRFDKLEMKITDQSQVSYEAKERSHKAYNRANEASNKAVEAAEVAKSALDRIEDLEKRRYEDKIQENQSQKDTRNKFYIALASSSIPWILTIIMGVIYIAKNNGF